MKITSMAKNQLIIEDRETVTFQSYQSTIAIFNKENNSLIVGKDWNYSKTTIKYFNMFIEKFTNFESGKKNIEKQIKNNIIEYCENL